MSQNINPTVPLLSNPVALDVPIQAIQLALRDNLPWLVHSFGKVFKKSEDRMIVSQGSKRKIRYSYPAVYLKKREYISLDPPQDSWNSYSFIEAYGEEKLQNPNNDTGAVDFDFRTPIAVVVVANISRINSADDSRWDELLKMQVLTVLKAMNSVVYRINGITKTFAEAFSEYSTSTVDHDWQTDNYAFFKFKLEIGYSMGCTQDEIFIPSVQLPSYT